MHVCRVVTIALREIPASHTGVRAECARLWNRLAHLHRWFRKRRLPWPTEGALKAHFKGRFALHSQTIQGLIERFCANVEATKTNRAKGDRRARYPHRCKSYVTPLWKGQSIRRDGTRLALPMGKGRKPLRVRLPALPAGKIVKVELGFGHLYVTLTNEVAVPARSERVGAGDLGIIHTIAMTDGRQTQMVVGRGLRSVAQGHNKAKAELSALRDRCARGSRRARRLTRAIRKAARRRENLQRNALHHAANLVRDFVADRNLGTFHVGDVTEMNHGKRGKRSRQLNQEVGNVPLGQFVAYLEYKLSAVGCALSIGDESYTSQTCPACGEKTKPHGRFYTCRGCRFTAARDQVGCWNILNKCVYGTIIPGALVPSGTPKYLRPVVMRSHRPRSGVAPLTPGTLLGTTPAADGAHGDVGEALGAVLSAA
jgi:putative transposase